MRKYSNCSPRKGLTVLEVMLVLFTATLLAVMLLPMRLTGDRTLSTGCLYNQRQCALGFTLFMADNNNQYPWHLPATNSAYIPGSTNGVAVADFNELQNTYIKAPTIFICPTDPRRTALADLSPLKNSNLSYGAGYDTGSNASANILTFDRHLLADGNPVSPGLFLYSTNKTMAWSSELHRSSAPRGVMSFYDGHAEIIPGTKINMAFQREGLAQARFAVP